MSFRVSHFLSFLATLPSFSRRHRHARRCSLGRSHFGVVAEVLEDRRLLATLVVNDDGGGDHATIQAAINAAAAGDTILINGGADRIHTEQGITVNQDVMLQGTPGMTQVIVQAAPTPGTATDRVFLITSGTSATINHLLIRHGQRTFSSVGTPQVFGGGILVDGGELTLRNSTLSQNSAGFGGGIYVSAGDLTVENSTFVSNRAFQNGGGLLNTGGTTTILNSTFSQNTADSDGGGLFNASGTSVIANSTLTANRIGNVINDGGGLFGITTGDFNSTILISTIVAGNFEGSGSDAADIGGIMNASLSANNLVGDAATSGGLVHGQNGNIVGNNGIGTLDTDSILNPTLANNGGVTQTHALVPGSLAIDAGSNPANLAFDQRGMGFRRTVGLRPDIGAFERQPVIVDDDGAGDFLTIQAAINAILAGDTILVTGGADRIHTEEGITVNKSVTIQGEMGETQVIVQAAATPSTATTPVFTVQQGVTAAIDNLTIRHGRRGIFNDGNLTINNSIISQNSISASTVQAAGIFNRRNLTILGSSITDNTGALGGGGIMSSGFFGRSMVVIRNSDISNNAGVGISTTDTDLVISGSRFQNNDGFGMDLFTSQAEISTTLISGNLGHGIRAGGTGFTVSDSTVAGNRDSGIEFVLATNPGVILNSTFTQNGIGVRVNNSELTISNSTFTGNGVGIVATPLPFSTIPTSLDLTSTIVAGNGTAGRPEDLRIQGTIFQAMNNLIGDAGSSGGIVHGQNGNIVGNNGVGTININTVLDTTLQDNGGPTPTHALVPGSPAINAGLNPFGLPFDQRGAGFPRMQNGQTDIGAVESTLFPVEVIPALAFGSGGGIPAQVRVFNSALDELFRLFPYEDFLGGVRVALADVTGDNVTDIITAAGTGGGSHIKVFDGLTGEQIRSFFAYDPSFLGGVFVAAADLNNDGRADIITGADAGGGPHVRAFSGLDGSLLFDFFAFDPGFQGGVRVAASDISFDGRPDIITSAGPGGGPHVRVFDGTNPLLASQGINIPGPLGSFFAYEATYNGGVYVGADNNFVFPDDTLGPFIPLVFVPGPLIITGSGLRIGGPEVGLFGPSGPPEYFQLPQYSEARVALLDVNQDGFNDYLAATGPQANGQVQIYSGDDRGTPLPFGPLLVSFFPFGELYRGGIFVAGSI